MPSRQLRRVSGERLIRIRQNRDERVSDVANRWKIEREFAPSSFDSIKGRNPAVGVSHVVNFTALEEVQREMKIK